VDEGQEHVKATYRGDYEGLSRRKARYEARNVFGVYQDV
jgi:hypothetical protein